VKSVKRFGLRIWTFIKALGMLWPWRKKSEAEVRSREMMKYLLRDREGQKLFRTLRKQQKKGQPMDPATGEGRQLMDYLLRDEQGRQLLTTMMPNRQGRRNARKMPVKNAAPSAKAARKKQEASASKQRRWRFPWSGRAA